MLDPTLSRLERQIMEALYTLRLAGAREVAQHLGEPDLFDSVRVTLLGLQKKGMVIAQPDGRRNVYRPAQERRDASAEALAAVTRIFFGGSTKDAVVALLDQGRDSLAAEDLEALDQWVRAQTHRTRRPRKNP
jgi:BlaI family transcriptional regulator, penicillinase repressor